MKQEVAGIEKPAPGSFASLRMTERAGMPVAALVLIAASLGGSVHAQDSSEIPASVVLAPSGKLEGAFASFGGSVRGKSIQVAEFRYAAPRTRSDLDAEIRPKDLGKALADAFVAEVGPKLKGAGIGLDRTAGELRLTGTVTKYLQPRKAASWTGWVGSPSGEGEIRFEMKISDPAGQIVAAIRHRIPLPPTKSASEAIREAMRNEVAPFLVEAAR